MRVVKLDGNEIFGVHKTEVSEGNAKLQALLDTCPELFKDELGYLKGTTVTIYLEEDAMPRFCKPRVVPLAYKDKINEEIDRFVKEGVLKPVTFSRWAAPIVPVLKSSGKIRICGDYKRTINQVANTDIYPLPHVDELYAKLTGGENFTKLDLSNAYQQLALDEKSQEYTTINTEKGLYSYTRMPFGISAAPAIFQRTIDSILQGIPMTMAYLDDILASGEIKKNISRI